MALTSLDWLLGGCSQPCAVNRDTAVCIGIVAIVVRVHPISTIQRITTLAHLFLLTAEQNIIIAPQPNVIDLQNALLLQQRHLSIPHSHRCGLMAASTTPRMSRHGVLLASRSTRRGSTRSHTHQQGGSLTSLPVLLLLHFCCKSLLRGVLSSSLQCGTNS